MQMRRKVRTKKGHNKHTAPQTTHQISKFVSERQSWKLSCSLSPMPRKAQVNGPRIRNYDNVAYETLRHVDNLNLYSLH
jgi:hypothetical protein